MSSPPMPVDESRPVPRAWLIVALLWVAAIINYIDRSMLATIRSSLVEQIPMTDAQFGLLISAFAWVYCVVSPFAGFLADRFSRSGVIIVSLFLWSVITWLTAYASTYRELLLSRALLGVTEACYLPASVALIIDYHRGTTRSLASGVHLTGIAIGGGLGGLGGVMASHYSWNMPFTFFGLAGIGYCAVLGLFLRDRPRVRTEKAAPPQVKFTEAIQSLFSYRSFVFAFAVAGLAALATGNMNGWLPTFLKEQFHMTQGAAGLAGTAYNNGAGIFGLLVGGWWGDRWFRSQPRGRLNVLVLGMGLTAPAVLLIATTSLLPAGLLGLALYGFCWSMYGANLMPVLCQITDVRYRATAFGLLNMFAGFMSGIATLAAGALRDAHVNFSLVLMFDAAAILTCALLMSCIKPRAIMEP